MVAVFLPIYLHGDLSTLILAMCAQELQLVQGLCTEAVHQVGEIVILGCCISMSQHQEVLMLLSEVV